LIRLVRMWAKHSNTAVAVSENRQLSKEVGLPLEPFIHLIAFASF
jgi:hypothetical protein